MATGGEETPTTSLFAELLSTIKGVETRVDEKLSQLRSELKDECESADIPEDGKREAIRIQRGGAKKTGLGRRRSSPTTAGGGKNQVSSARRSEVNLHKAEKD